MATINGFKNENRDYSKVPNRFDAFSNERYDLSDQTSPAMSIIPTEPDAFQVAAQNNSVTKETAE